MTILPVSKSVYDTTERLLAADPDIPPIADLWWCEPCAGTGNILRQMPAERRIAWDINPQDKGELGIIQGDYTKQRLDPTNRYVVLGNGPFTSGDPDGGPLGFCKWAMDQPCVKAVGIITPHWFQSPTTTNKLNAYFHHIHLEVLPEKSFTRHGQLIPSPTIFTLWVRRDYRRNPIVIRTKHPDWEWLPTRRIAEADVWMQMRGVGVGTIKYPNDLGRMNYPNDHAFIRRIRPGTIGRLRAIDWQDVCYPSLSTPRIHRYEVVSAYIARYGNPDAEDYDPDAATPLGIEPSGRRSG